MAVMKTPGVYIVEKNAFPNSIVEVATAVPAFVGYTQIASNGGRPLKNKPFRISSMAEFVVYFGGPPTPKFTITAAVAGAAPEADFAVAGQGYYLAQTGVKYTLYYSMLWFFQNGGGPCFVVSVGDYNSPIALPDLTGGVDALASEQEPTMVVAPECMQLADAGTCNSAQQHILAHCGDVMKNRFAILDIFGGDKPRTDPGGDPIEAFRDALGVNFLNFGAAYYPWLHTTIVQDRDIGFQNIDSGGVSLETLLNADMQLPAPNPDPRSRTPQQVQQQTNLVAAIAADPAGMTTTQLNQLNQSLLAMSDAFGDITSSAARHLNLLPPSAAMAGLYTMVDNNRGVWKAPANISVNSAVAPAVTISNGDQEDLNVTPMGKSINAIRAFIGEGVLVWGARTLDGNSLDWRYINVRRTMIMLEESCRLAAKAMVFEPNVAGTWLTIRSMIENFLTSVWKRGGLAGAVPEDAFSVFVGLGETMTADDILEGILRVTVLVAISHPAEFIEITFQQQMQKS